MSRLASLDLLRGIVMMLMVVDHARDYQAGVGVVADPMDLTRTPVGLFWMRWMTHFCAPVFAFCMGASAWLSRQDSSRLLKRGLLLVVLEFTLISWAWTFNPLWPRMFFQVIAALGLGLVTLAMAVRLSRGAVAAVAVLVLAGHNAFDAVRFAEGSWQHYVWSFLHQKNVLPLPGGFEVRTTYPFVPIAAVAWLGYAMGAWLEQRRWRALAWTGAGMLLLHLVLRVFAGYGDMARFTPDDWRSLVNVTKYPLSLQFVLITAGPALLLLAALRDRAVLAPVRLLGRVPMFFYVTHLYAVHALALLIALAKGYPLAAFEFNKRFGGVPAGFGFPLGATVLFAFAVICLLYPACAWYEQVRRSRRWPVLAYF